MNPKFRIAVLFGIVFLEIMAYNMVSPYFYPIFFGGQLLSNEISLADKKIFYGLLMTCYPLAQVIGAPLMGAFSDKFGRKKAFIFTLCSNIFGYLLGALALVYQFPLYIFLGFFLSGLAGGNISISQSAVADISTPKTKAKNMSLVFTSYGLCYSLGPLIGGLLSYVSLSPHSSFPFFCAAGVSFINLVFILLLFKETFLLKSTKSVKKQPLHLWKIVAAIKRRENWRLMGVIFFSFFGWNFFFKANPMYLKDQFQFMALENSLTLAYFGFCTTLGQGLILPYLHAHTTPQQFIRFSTLALGLSFFMMPMMSSLIGFFFCFTLACFSYSFILPNLNASISNLNSKESQGKIMGLSQGIQSLAKTLSPLPAAYLSSLLPSLPLVTSACLLLLTYLIYEFFIHQPSQQPSHLV